MEKKLLFPLTSVIYVLNTLTRIFFLPFMGPVCIDFLCSLDLILLFNFFFIFIFLVLVVILIGYKEILGKNMQTVLVRK